MKSRANEKNKQRSLWMEAWRRLRKNKLAMAGLGFILLLVVLALFTIAVDLITQNSFYTEHVVKQNLRLRLQGPSKEHIFGLDEFGRDIFLRVIWAIRYSLFMGTVAIGISVVLPGNSVNAPCIGYRCCIRNKPDESPACYCNKLCPDIREDCKGVCAYSQGSGVYRGRQSPWGQRRENHREIHHPELSCSWGSMLSNARSYIRDGWHITVIPGLMIMLTILSLNVLGDGLRDALDPRLKN